MTASSGPNAAQASDACKAKVLILTPVKDGASYAERYFELLRALTYPASLISLAVLESDSRDDSARVFSEACLAHQSRFRDARFFKKDFGYRIADGVPRWEPGVQLERRRILARSRNHLLFRALDDEDWVLWLDVDVIDYPPDIIETLISYGKDILHPNCVKTRGGPSFDLNAWRDHGLLHMHDLRGQPGPQALDAVGGTMLLVRADCHRDGLVFPPFLYGSYNRRVRARGDIFLPDEHGEVETEGLGILASDMGLECWGLPDLEIVHADK